MNKWSHTMIGSFVTGGRIGKLDNTILLYLPLFLDSHLFDLTCLRCLYVCLFVPQFSWSVTKLVLFLFLSYIVYKKKIDIAIFVTGILSGLVGITG